MSDFDDLELQKSAPQDGGRRRRWPLLAAVAAVVLALLAAGGYYFLLRPRPAPTPAPLPAVQPSPSPAPAPSPAVEAPTELPSLDASDELVRRLVSGLSSSPRLAALLAPAGLVRRFVAAVDNIALGQSPRPNLLELAPREGFRARHEAAVYTVDPASWRRYDSFAETFASLDAAGAADVYRRLHPLVETAYRELGYPRADFDATLARAIDRLLATPIPAADARLVPRGAGFAWADPGLESLSAADKAFLRMGPDNVQRVKAKLRELRAALALPPAGG